MNTITKAFKALFIGSLIFLSFNSKAQSQETSGAWHTLLIKHKINSKFTFKNELHVRRTQFYAQWQQLLIRPAIDYALTNNAHLAAGYSFINNYSPKDNAIEHNVWEEIVLSNPVKSVNIKHRFRFEQRFAQDFFSEKFKHSNRFRYRITLKKALYKKDEETKLSAEVFNELWLHTGNGIKPQSINQNWFYMGLALPLNNSTTLSGGYLNIHVPLKKDFNLTSHILQLSLTVNI